MGIPAPTPIPLMGEFFNYFRKVNLMARLTSSDNVYFDRVYIETMYILLKNTVKLLGKFRVRTSF